MDEETLLKLKFPSVTRSKHRTSEFYGVLRSVDNDPVLVSFTVPNFPKIHGLLFEIGADVSEERLAALQAETNNVNLSFCEFIFAVHKTILNLPRKRRMNTCCVGNFWEDFRLIRSYNPLDTFLFNEKNETVTLKKVDEFGAEKYIIVHVDFYDDNMMYKVVKHNFVDLHDSRFNQRQMSLEFLYKVFLDVISKSTPFHAALQKIDDLCWVLAPSTASFDYNYRTIVLENNVSMKITFKPWHMSKLPEFQFFGPSENVEKFRNGLSENLANWDAERDIIQNIKCLLDCFFLPVKPEEEPEKTTENVVLYDSNTECSICFCYHLNSESPDLICENKSCFRHFHNECLFEWLSRLPNSQLIFESWSGECPNCEKIISCKIPASKK